MQTNNKNSSVPSTVANPFRRRLIKRIVIGAALAIVPVDAVFGEPRRLDVTKHSVHIDGLHTSHGGLRIAQLSDLHLSLCVPEHFIRRAVEECNALKPDVAVFTGDFISHNGKNAAPCAKLLREVRAPMGSFAVLGNHDHWVDADRVTRSLEDEGIRVLTNRNVNVGGLHLAGVDDVWAGDCNVASALNGIPADAPLVTLSHSPLALPMLRDRKCLILAGHTHGGHVNIPVITQPVVRIAKCGHYVAGWYKDSEARMYVNRGIGGTPIRFRARPEVSLFVLRSKSKD